MTKDKINVAIAEAQRFITRAKAALSATDDKYSCFGNQYTAAARRASLDLTRALANMRRPE